MLAGFNGSKQHFEMLFQVIVWSTIYLPILGPLACFYKKANRVPNGPPRFTVDLKEIKYLAFK